MGEKLKNFEYNIRKLGDSVSRGAKQQQTHSVWAAFRVWVERLKTSLAEQSLSEKRSEALRLTFAASKKE